MLELQKSSAGRWPTERDDQFTVASQIIAVNFFHVGCSQMAPMGYAQLRSSQPFSMGRCKLGQWTCATVASFILLNSSRHSPLSPSTAYNPVAICAGNSTMFDSHIWTDDQLTRYSSRGHSARPCRYLCECGAAGGSANGCPCACCMPCLYACKYFGALCRSCTQVW